MARFFVVASLMSLLFSATAHAQFTGSAPLVQIDDPTK